MNFSSTWVITILVLIGTECFSSLSSAAKTLSFKNPFCDDAKAIQPKGKFCQDNEVFTRSAEKCLAKLKAKTEKEGALVKKLMAIKESGKNQNQDFKKAAFDHNVASKKLSELIKLSKRVELELDSYFDRVYLPVDYDSNEVNGGKPDDYALSVPCYGDTVRAIDSIIDDVDEIRLDLTEAKKVADAFRKELSGSGKDLKQISEDDIDSMNKVGQDHQKGFNSSKSGISNAKKKGKKSNSGN